ncbi:MAG: nickel pincer cofactor biosynthesis protein LarC [Phycisphaerae bacterium]
MKVLYFDCFNGAAGDMLAGALIDSGVSIERIQTELRALNVSGYTVEAQGIRKQGFAATKFDVHMDATESQPHRHLHHIEKIIAESTLSERVRQRVMSVFERLADAEAAAHGTTREKVHFHEVGAIDAIVDIVSVCLAVEIIAPDRIVASHLPVGSGTVKCEHGIMPVPAPATAMLLKGVPIQQTDETGELLTPTAAALLTELCDEFGPLPSINIEQIGLGAGTRDGKTRPNILRALIGTSVAASESSSDTVAVLEANIDDAPGEWVGHCVTRLLDAGVLDAYTVPIYMKKGRPGVVLSVICEPKNQRRIEDLIFSETSTFGIRHRLMQRTKLNREHRTVETPYGPIRIKIGSRDGQVFSATAEYEDCAAAAKSHDVALRTVVAAAMKTYGDNQ